MISAGESRVIIPGNEIPFFRILGTVEVIVSGSHIVIPGQNMKGHPITDITHIKMFFHDLFYGNRIIIDLLQQLQQLGMIIVSFDFQQFLKGFLIVIRIRLQFQGFVLIPFEKIDLI